MYDQKIKAAAVPTARGPAVKNGSKFCVLTKKVDDAIVAMSNATMETTIAS